MLVLADAEGVCVVSERLLCATSFFFFLLFLSFRRLIISVPHFSVLVQCFGGYQVQYSHESLVLGCSMKFSVFFPSLEASSVPSSGFPVLVYLSGLTCTDENVVTKAGAQRAAAEAGIAFVAPDTSPRGLGYPGEDDSYDFGTGAGFYLDATAEPWSGGYRMRSYLLDELFGSVLAGLVLDPQAGSTTTAATAKAQDTAAAPSSAAAASLTPPRSLLDLTRTSLVGHSMGGHGALTLALSSPGRFKSVSAFAPIVNPSQVPWGRKAFAGYLGEAWAKEETWKRYDACELAGTYAGPHLDVLVDQGTADDFYPTQLQPERFLTAVATEAKTQGKSLDEDVSGTAAGARVATAASDALDVTLRFQPGYDHSYFFIATFIEEHIKFHAKHLQ